MISKEDGPRAERYKWSYGAPISRLKYITPVTPFMFGHWPGVTVFHSISPHLKKLVSFCFLKAPCSSSILLNWIYGTGKNSPSSRHQKKPRFSRAFVWSKVTVGGWLRWFLYVPWSKVAILGMVIPPLTGNPYNWYIKPYYWVDDHPLLYGNNGS